MKNQNTIEVLNLAISLLAVGRITLARNLAVFPEKFKVNSKLKTVDICPKFARMTSVELLTELYNCFKYTAHINNSLTVLDLHELYLNNVIDKKTMKNFYFYYDMAMSKNEETFEVVEDVC